MPESGRPEWLWDTDFAQDEMARLARQARTYIEHLEVENSKLMDESIEVLQQNLKQDYRIEDLAGERNHLRQDKVRLEAEIERLNEVERSRCDCGHPKADHDFSNPDFNTPCLPRSRCSCNNYVPLYPTPTELPPKSGDLDGPEVAPYEGDVPPCPRCGGERHLHLGSSVQVVMDHSLVEGQDYWFCHDCNEMTPIESPEEPREEIIDRLDERASAWIEKNRRLKLPEEPEEPEEPKEPKKCPECGGPLYLQYGGGFGNIGVDVCRDCGYHPATHSTEEQMEE